MNLTRLLITLQYYEPDQAAHNPTVQYYDYEPDQAAHILTVL